MDSRSCPVQNSPTPAVKGADEGGRGEVVGGRSPPCCSRALTAQGSTATLCGGAVQTTTERSEGGEGRSDWER